MTINGKPALGIHHTAPFLVDVFKALLDERLPTIESFHMVDESLVQEAQREGGLTPEILRRVEIETGLARDAGADLVLYTCATISPAADILRPKLSIPLIKIDEPAAVRAVALGERIQLICTSKTAIESVKSVIEEKAREAGKRVTVVTHVEHEAYAMRRNGDKAGHDRSVVDGAMKLPRNYDVLVLGQASMAHLAPELEKALGVPVLGNTTLCIDAIAEWLKAGSRSMTMNPQD
jgi:Asp/Glu/hydantoin racemase